MSEAYQPRPMIPDNAPQRWHPLEVFVMVALLGPLGYFIVSRQWHGALLLLGSDILMVMLGLWPLTLSNHVTFGLLIAHTVYEFRQRQFALVTASPVTRSAPNINHADTSVPLVHTAPPPSCGDQEIITPQPKSRRRRRSKTGEEA